LLALAIAAKADYLVTGDYDLLVLNAIEGCQIVNVETFEQAFH
jgi:predicted nucleic acid-binding protein